MGLPANKVQEQEQGLGSRVKQHAMHRGGKRLLVEETIPARRKQSPRQDQREVERPSPKAKLPRKKPNQPQKKKTSAEHR